MTSAVTNATSPGQDDDFTYFGALGVAGQRQQIEEIDSLLAVPAREMFAVVRREENPILRRAYAVAFAGYISNLLRMLATADGRDQLVTDGSRNSTGNGEDEFAKRLRKLAGRAGFELAELQNWILELVTYLAERNEPGWVMSALTHVAADHEGYEANQSGGLNAVKAMRHLLSRALPGYDPDADTNRLDAVRLVWTDPAKADLVLNPGRPASPTPAVSALQSEKRQLEAANSNLTGQLKTAERTIADLRGQLVAAKAQVNRQEGYFEEISDALRKANDLTMVGVLAQRLSPEAQEVIGVRAL